MYLQKLLSIQKKLVNIKIICCYNGKKYWIKYIETLKNCLKILINHYTHLKLRGNYKAYHHNFVCLYNV